MQLVGRHQEPAVDRGRFGLVFQVILGMHALDARSFGS